MALVTSNGSTNIVGRIGDSVYVPYKGGTYVRKAPTTRKGARTPAMLLNQQRFACIHRFCAQFKRLLIPQVWNDAATTNSGYNLMMKANSPAFARYGSMGDYKLLKLTTGKLLLPLEITAQREPEGSATILVNWKLDSHLGSERLRNELMVIVQNNGVFSGISATGLIKKKLRGHFSASLKL